MEKTKPMQHKFNHAQNHVKSLPDELKGHISDGYHTFDELYEHRCVLWYRYLELIQHTYNAHDSRIDIACTVVDKSIQTKLQNQKKNRINIYKCKKHHDGSEHDGLFLSLVVLSDGRQLSYHLPMNYWEEIAGEEYDVSPVEYDGHTSNDVLKMLKEGFKI